MTDGELLRRFVVESRALSPPVERWLAAIVWSALPPSRRRRIRNELLKEAGRRLGDLSAWAKAHELARLSRHPAGPDATTPGGLVALGVSLYGCGERSGRGLSPSQVFRVLVSRVLPSSWKSPPS